MTNRPYISKEVIKDAAGNEFDLELYKRYNASSETTRYEYSLYDKDDDQVIPDVIGSFEFFVGDNDEYAMTDDVYLDVNYRHHNLYRIILDHAKNYFKSIGLKGVMSKGRSRSEDATRSWEKIKTRQEESPEAYNGRKYVDFYLESRLMTFESYVIAEDIRQKRIAQIKKIAEEENIRTEGDFIFLYHGTSAANMKKILKSGKFKMGTWFAKTLSESEKYAAMKGSKPATSVFVLYMGSLTYNGYFTSQEDLHYWRNGKYAPKGYKES